MCTEWQERGNWLDLPATWSHCIACEPVVQVWISGIKGGNHARSIARTSRFANSRLCCVCITLQYTTSQYFILQALPWLRWLVTNLSPRWPGGPVHVALWWKKLYCNRFCLIMTFRSHLVDSLLAVNQMWPWKNCSLWDEIVQTRHFVFIVCYGVGILYLTHKELILWGFNSYWPCSHLCMIKLPNHCKTGK